MTAFINEIARFIRDMVDEAQAPRLMLPRIQAMWPSATTNDLSAAMERLEVAAFIIGQDAPSVIDTRDAVMRWWPKLDEDAIGGALLLAAESVRSEAVRLRLENRAVLGEGVDDGRAGTRH